MIAGIAIAAMALIPVAIVAAILALVAGAVGSVAERDLGVGFSQTGTPDRRPASGQAPISPLSRPPRRGWSRRACR